MSAGDSYVRRLARCHILQFGTEGKTVLILVKERIMGGGEDRREVLCPSMRCQDETIDWRLLGILGDTGTTHSGFCLSKGG